jgi:hypothetical protein
MLRYLAIIIALVVRGRQKVPSGWKLLARDAGL